MMDLGRLRSFTEVAERGTVAAAAAAQDYTAPAVSQHIAKLEHELGCALFDRAGGRLRLTDAGRALLPVARDMLDLDTRARLAVTRPAPVPHYVIAGFASALAAVVVPRLGAMAGRMTVELVEQEDTEAIRDLRLGAVDLVLTQEYEGSPAERDDRFVFTPIVTDQLRLVLPDAMAASTRVEELGEADWLLNGTGTRCAEATERILRGHGIDPAISGRIADNDTLLALVAAGHGVTIVPELLLGPHRPGVTVGTNELGLSRTIFAVSRTVSGTSVGPLVDLLTCPPLATGS